MDENELEKQLVKAFKSRNSCSREIKRIEKAYTALLCPKGKNEYEPEYCTFRMTATCPFLEKWHLLTREYDFSK